MASDQLLQLAVLAEHPGGHGHRECRLGGRALGHQSIDRLKFLLSGRGRATFLAIDAQGDELAFTSLIGYLGAGVYEETLFRLILVPVLFVSLKCLQMPQVLASALAVTGSALLFALAHHAGSPGEPFTWFAFIFRWMAGVFFAWVFVLRGFGIAVGTHTMYDILVGWIAWRF